MENARSILFIAEELEQSEPIAQILRREGHTVENEAGFASGVERAARGAHDLVIFDLLRPDLDAAELCQRMRDGGVSVPILLLTTRGGETDIVVALDAGADDYVVKPFRVAELLARVRALLRRSDDLWAAGTEPIMMDKTARRVFRNGREVALTKREFDLLAVLLRHQGHVVSREVLTDELWGIGAGQRKKTIDMHISALRNALDDDPTNPRHIITIRGVGFRLDNAPHTAGLLVHS